MPAQQGLGTDDREEVEDRRPPSVELDKEPALAVRQPGPAVRLSENDENAVGVTRRLTSFSRMSRLAPMGLISTSKSTPSITPWKWNGPDPSPWKEPAGLSS
jgi:hypothetical protein